MVNHIEPWAFADFDDQDRLVESVNARPPSVYGCGHETYNRNVLEVLFGSVGPDTDRRDGRKSQGLILAIHASVRTGSEVPLPLHVGY